MRDSARPQAPNGTLPPVASFEYHDLATLHRPRNSHGSKGDIFNPLCDGLIRTGARAVCSVAVS
jgi:hypothetical protein